MKWILSGLILLLGAAARHEETVLFDFEDPASIQDWSRQAGKVDGALSTEHATSGQRSLKLTFSGNGPSLVTLSRLPIDDWSGFQTFRADVFASGEGVLLFRVLQEKSTRGKGWGDLIGRWEKAARLVPGKNEVCDTLHPYDEGAIHKKFGKAVGFEIGFYGATSGTTIYLDHVRLSPKVSEKTTPFRGRNVVNPGDLAAGWPKLDRKFRVLGLDAEVANPSELAERLRSTWTKPESRTVDEVEAEVRKDHLRLKETHPEALLALFREGSPGFDPGKPTALYSGWKDAFLWGHDPGSVYLDDLGVNHGAKPMGEHFLRRRATLTQVDLSSIPRGSRILSAKLLLVRANGVDKDFPATRPTFFVAEPCRRAWKENEVNTLEFARGRYWKEVCGMNWDGDDPDFAPLFIAYGQSQLTVSSFDFTEAVKYWTSGEQANCGFVLYCARNAMDFLVAHTKEAAEIRNRPCLLVSYVPR